jgi:hypothetical protein
MAWKDMTPHGRGYSTGLTYFDYDTDFWTEAKPMCGTGKAKLETVECVTWAGARSCAQERA